MTGRADPLAVIEAEIAVICERLSHYRKTADKTAERKGAQDMHAERLCEWAAHRIAQLSAAKTDVSALVEAARKVQAKLDHPTASVTALDAAELRAALAPFGEKQP